jgi:hypothetical protein
VRPICFAVFKLFTNSNFVGCSTGKVAGTFRHNLRAVKTVVENWEKLTTYYDFPRVHALARFGVTGDVDPGAGTRCSFRRNPR